MSLPPEDPTTSPAPRPADAARQALRAARQRADAERGQARDGEEPTPAGAAVREPGPARQGAGAGCEQVREGDEETPAGLAHRVLKEARKRSQAGRAPQSATAGEDSAGVTGAPVGQDGGESWPEDAAAPRPATAPADATTSVRDESPVSRARPVSPAGGRPADIAREALRAGAPVGQGGGEPWPEDAAAPRPATAPADAITPVRDESPVSRARPVTPAGARPGDIAREALRAARREAVRAEAEADAEAAERRAARGGRTAQPRTRRGAPAPGRSVASASRAASGPDSRATRIKATQDMRHYPANAFRMPTWSDTPDEEPRPSDPSADAGHPAHPEPPSTASTPTAESRPDRSPTAPVPTADDSHQSPPDAAPAHPYLPATMATPHRDTELRRTFPAFAVRAAAEEGVRFAGTWWGNAWADALEQGALDAKRLARGRGYADQGHVDAITVTPGLVLAYVRGSRPRPYRVQVRLRTLEDQDWERFLDAAADRPGHIAALLDKELPQSLADCGVPLLPGPGDLAPQCSCPDSGHPCKHAAALCYQTARLLDADPFVLLLLRGRGEKDLLDALSRRSAARAARAAQERQADSLPGVRATDALAPRRLPPLPPPLPVPPHSGQPPVYPAAPGGPDPFALDQLATDAAARAHALLDTGRDPVGELTLWQDAVRLAAARPGSGLTAATRTLYATLATAVGRTPSDLARAVAAWRQGASAGLAALEEPWDPPAGRFDRARPLLLAADLPAFRPWRNRLTHPHGHAQLRLGRDGLWYAYESEPGRDDWWPRGTPDLDPVGALTGLGTPDDL
ncbi:SWIM zinc finger family protein [Streptomyces sp. NPDC055966]|uniref:SWIM zinc finger family protein n=1 Tax=Streptomyces sp. NPDC055966 TaxID=3345669 RepID=UPI0035DA0ADA